jgi:hypothetical protein
MLVDTPIMQERHCFAPDLAIAGTYRPSSQDQFTTAQTGPGQNIQENIDLTVTEL